MPSPFTEGADVPGDANDRVATRATALFMALRTDPEESSMVFVATGLLLGWLCANADDPEAWMKEMLDEFEANVRANLATELESRGKAAPAEVRPS